MGHELLVNRRQNKATQLYRRVDEHAMCMCMAQELRPMLSRNDAITDASVVVRTDRLQKSHY
jgi:hypothetical protein